MNITWSDLFCILEKMFDMDSETIANHLDVNPSTISRIKSGETQRFTSYSKEELYKKIFDPANAPLKENKNYLLSLLKNTLEDLGFRKVMEDLWTDENQKGDYEKFVLKMLERTVKNYSHEDKPQSKKKSTRNSTSNNNSNKVSTQNEVLPNNKGKVESQYENPSVQMQEIFGYEVFYYDIEGFIKSEQICSLNSNFFDNIKSFIETIEAKLKSEFFFKKENKIYQKISEFIYILNEYTRYLRSNMRIFASFADSFTISPSIEDKIHITRNRVILTYVPEYSDEHEEWTKAFMEKTRSYYQKLNSLYNEIFNADIE